MTEPSAVTVSVIPSAPALRGLVTFYYHVTATAPISDFLYPEWGNIRFALAGEWQVAVAGGYDRVPQRAVLFGPTDRRGLVTATPGRMAGAGFTPVGWYRLLRGDDVLANAVRPLADELGDPAVLAHRLDTDPAAAARAWDEVLTERLAPTRAEDARVARLDMVLRERPRSVADFAARADLSERSLHRACLRLFGFPPKRLLRRERFLETLGRVRAAVRAPVTPSLGGDYYDLPQFYRDFREFMGLSAPDYFAHPRSLMGPAAVAQMAAGVTLSFAHMGPTETAMSENAKTGALDSA